MKPSTDIDRVFTDSETRLLRVRATLLDVSAWYDAQNTRVQISNPVPVRSEDGRLLGYASVYMEGSRLRADLALDYASPERLNVQTGSSPLYAVPVGEVKAEFHSSLSNWQPSKPLHASLVSVWGIVLSPTGHGEPLGDDVL
jgi:hypothetical protein